MGLIRYMLTSDSRKSLKKLNAMADKIEALDAEYSALSEYELKNKTNSKII